LCTLCSNIATTTTITVMMMPRMRILQSTTRRCYTTTATRFHSLRTTTTMTTRSSSSSSNTESSPGPGVEPSATEATTPPTPPLPPLASSSPFPWRSSPILLDRLEVPNDLSGSLSSRSAFHISVRQAFAARKLQYGFPSIFLGSWKQELADDLGWAFQKGLAGLLSHVLSSEYTLFCFPLVCFCVTYYC
jgi:hypothetical protein